MHRSEPWSDEKGLVRIHFECLSEAFEYSLVTIDFLLLLWYRLSASRDIGRVPRPLQKRREIRLKHVFALTNRAHVPKRE
jgi:hypothetical protein